MADQLRGQIRGSTLEQVDILSGRYARHGVPGGFQAFCRDALPAVVSDVRCKGKFIYLLCAPASGAGHASIWCTLAMSGRFTLREEKHSRVRFSFAEEKGNDPVAGTGPGAAEGETSTLGRHVYFTDQRNFGTLTFSLDADALEGKLKAIGPSFLLNQVSAETFLTIVQSQAKRRADRPLAVFLMDQGKTSGIGNYILSEALYRSAVDPWLAVGDLEEQQWLHLHASITTVIEASYASQGVSRALIPKDDAPTPTKKGAKRRRGGDVAGAEDGIVKEEGTGDKHPQGMYRGLDGSPGTYAFQLQVYGRRVTPAGEEVIKETGSHKRAIHYVARQMTPAGEQRREAFQANPVNAGTVSDAD